MALEERVRIIREIERIRGSDVICYLTSIRPNIQAMMGQDHVRVFHDHLRSLRSRHKNKLDIFLCSNGGDSVVPWRLVSLFREFYSSFNVLIPYRSYSAATLLALGADQIVMHPFAELGPIDPTVTNHFNPKDDDTKLHLGISVEDVKAYVNFIKSTVGITHEDELVEAIKILAERVHPLALGNVERFISQSRMIAQKILKTHMQERDAEYVIAEIVENMASKLYFHGHPINRVEAVNDLRLKIDETRSEELEELIWQLYLEYEATFENLSVFNPVGDLVQMLSPDPTVQPQPFQIQTTAGAMPAIAPNPVLSSQQDYDLLYAMIESASLSSEHRVAQRFQMIRPHGLLALQMQGTQIIRSEILSQAWLHTPIEESAGPEPTSSSPEATPSEAAAKR